MLGVSTSAIEVPMNTSASTMATARPPFLPCLFVSCAIVCLYPRIPPRSPWSIPLLSSKITLLRPTPARVSIRYTAVAAAPAPHPLCAGRSDCRRGTSAAETHVFHAHLARVGTRRHKCRVAARDGTCLRRFEDRANLINVVGPNEKDFRNLRDFGSLGLYLATRQQRFDQFAFTTFFVPRFCT